MSVRGGHQVRRESCMLVFGSWRAISRRPCALGHISAAMCVEDVPFLRSVFGDMSLWNQGRKVTALENNEGGIQLAKNPLSSLRPKHIHVRYHSLLNEIRQGNISLVHVRSSDSCADMVTKGLRQERFQVHRFVLGIRLILVKEDDEDNT